MERLKIDEGALKWGALGVAVVALECVGQDSLTHHARRALEHPIGRIVVPLAMGITTLHLLDRCPPQLDFYQGIANLIERVRNG